jgi:RNA polymerase sigma factor (TIGR02999 family)
MNGDVTLLLKRMSAGDDAAKAELFEAVYKDLKRMAAARLALERVGHTLQPTALVHEAFLRLPHEAIDFKDRLHFFAVASSVMRRLLVDHARSRQSRKRSAGQRVELTESISYDVTRPEEIIELNNALDRLTELNARQGQIVELRFFGGLTEEEIATGLNLSSRTVKREWKRARTWLHLQLTEGSRA